MRLPFYSVQQGAYLFAAKLAQHGGINAKEEPVRQWCAFELIRAYGLTISDLSFEEEVRVGSKTYRIDILVRRNGLPWIVIECKEPKHKKHEEGLEQAISYAVSVNVSAEYAIYTNGTAWQVKRKIEGEWNAVADIPTSGPARPIGCIDEFLRTVQDLSPLLNKLDEPLSGKDARIYLEALQRFFHGRNVITAAADHDLCCATDLVLRVLSTGPTERHYTRSKLSSAAERAESFRMKSGVGSPLTGIHENEPVYIFMSVFAGSLHAMMEPGRVIGGINHELVRLMMALLDYGREQARGGYPQFPAYLHAELRSFLTKAMALSMDLKLPDALEEKFTSDMKYFTRSAWDDLIEDDVKEQRETKNNLMSALFGSLRPSRWFARGKKGAV